VPDFPGRFTSIAHARQFCAGFFHEYNYAHHRSGIAWHTPASVHFGTATAIDQVRQNTLTAAYHAHRERFGHRPHPPSCPPSSGSTNQQGKPKSASSELSRLTSHIPEGVPLAKERGVYKGRRPTLSEEDRAEVRQRAASGESKLQLAKQYGISRETVYQDLRSHASGAAAGGNQAT
jgi:hypothetical protein